MPTDLYGGNVVKPYLGRIVLKKLAGAGPISAGAQIVLPHASAKPRNPLNTRFLSGVNSSSFPSADIAGKRTPSCGITTVVKTSSFFTADLLNSLLLAVDSNGDSDVWAILLDDLYAPVVYDGAKCTDIRVRQAVKGGPVSLSLQFNAMYGDGENPGSLFSPTTFSSTTIDPGSVTDVTHITFAGTADLVQGFSLDMSRPQSYVFYDDGTLFPAGIATGIFSGSMSITQSVKFASSWSGSGTVHMGTTGAGVSIAASLSTKADERDFTADPRLIVRTYTLYSSTGASPLTITAL